jgi:hypothetical protein
VTWLNDLDGDGNIDVVIRANTGLWGLFGWATTGGRRRRSCSTS